MQYQHAFINIPGRSEEKISTIIPYSAQNLHLALGLQELLAAPPKGCPKLYGRINSQEGNHQSEGNLRRGTLVLEQQKIYSYCRPIAKADPSLARLWTEYLLLVSKQIKPSL